MKKLLLSLLFMALPALGQTYIVHVPVTNAPGEGGSLWTTTAHVGNSTSTTIGIGVSKVDVDGVLGYLTLGPNQGGVLEDVATAFNLPSGTTIVKVAISCAYAPCSPASDVRLTLTTKSGGAIGTPVQNLTSLVFQRTLVFNGEGRKRVWLYGSGGYVAYDINGHVVASLGADIPPYNELRSFPLPANTWYVDMVPRTWSVGGYYQRFGWLTLTDSSNNSVFIQ